MDNNKLDALFSGLTGAHENQKKPVEQAKKQEKSQQLNARAKQKEHEQKNHEERFCTIVNSETLKKIRNAISVCLTLRATERLSDLPDRQRSSTVR